MIHLPSFYIYGKLNVLTLRSPLYAFFVCYFKIVHEKVYSCATQAKTPSIKHFHSMSDTANQTNIFRSLSG